MKRCDSFERPSTRWCPTHFNYRVSEPLVKELSILRTSFSETMLNESLTKTVQFRIIVVCNSRLLNSSLMKVKQVTHFFVLFWFRWNFCDSSSASFILLDHDRHWFIAYNDLEPWA